MMDRPGRLDGSPSPISPGTDYVRVPKVAFTATIAKLKSQQTQLAAARNLHKLMQEKDEALIAAEEKNRSLRAACRETEVRFADQLRSRCITGSSDARRKPPTSSLEADSAIGHSTIGQEGETDSSSYAHRKPATSSLQADSAIGYSTIGQKVETDSSSYACRKPATSSLQADSVMVHDVETDGCPVTLGRPEHPEFDYVNPPAMRTKTDFRTFAPTVFNKSEVEGSKSSFPSTTPSLTAPSASLNSGSSGTESKDLFEKLSQQNARLKKAIRDIIAHKGMTVSDYLDKQEYEDAADMLRQDYRQSQAQVERLKAIIKSRDASEVDKLAARCAELEEALRQAERRFVVLKAYADAVRQTHDNLVKEKKENESSKPSTSPPTNISPVVPTVTTSDYAKVVESLQRLKAESQSNDEMCKRLTEEKQQLLTELNSARQEIESFKQRGASSSDKLQQDFGQLLEENNILKSQLAVYQEDFTMERKERLEQKRHLEQKHATEMAEQRRQFESTLAKHQDWVRRLSEEARICRVSWESEKAKREELERKYVPRSPTSSCREEAPKISGTNKRQNLVPDIAEDGAGQQSVTARSASPSPSDISSDQSLVCPRCERTFSRSESAKFQQHLKRCRDD